MLLLSFLVECLRIVILEGSLMFTLIHDLQLP